MDESFIISSIWFKSLSCSLNNDWFIFLYFRISFRVKKYLTKCSGGNQNWEIFTQLKSNIKYHSRKNAKIDFLKIRHKWFD